MRLALFLSVLKSNRWSLLAWGGAVAVYGFFVVNIYETAGQAVPVELYLSAMPDWLRAAMGTEGMDPSAIFTAEGTLRLDAFLGVEYLSWWPVLLAFFAIFFAVGIVAREVERGTMDLILSHPLHRYQVVVTKFSVFLVGLLALGLASLVGIFIGSLAIEAEVNFTGLLLAHIQGVLLLLAIGGYSTLFSCIFLDPRRALAVSGLLTLALYLLNMIAVTLGSFQWVDKLSPFHYFQPLQILMEVKLDWSGVAIYLSIAIVSFLASLFVFERRDIIA